MKTVRSLALKLLTISVLSSPLLAQGPGGDNPRGNPEEFRKRMEERFKTGLKATDEEWSVLQPLIENVMGKQRELMSGRGGFGRGGNNGGGNNGGGGAPGGDQQRPGAAETAALRTTLENDSASADEIKAKLMALREQRKKATAGLAQARAELQKVLTSRQEALLVSYGILE